MFIFNKYFIFITIFRQNIFKLNLILKLVEMQEDFNYLL